MTGFRHDPVVSRAVVLLPRKHDHPLTMQRVIWIPDKNLLAVMMGSMQCSRWADPKQVLKYLARYTHRVAISNQPVCSTWRTARSVSTGRTTRIGGHRKR